MNSASETVLVISGTVIILAIVAAITFLTWHGSIAGAVTVGIFSTIVGIGGGALAVHSGVNAGASAAKNQPSPLDSK